LLEDIDLKRDEVYDLLGLLTVALGRLKPIELSRASTLLVPHVLDSTVNL